MKTNITNIVAPISIGELIDKITILEIKKIYIKDKKLINIEKELFLLENILKENDINIDINLVSQLKEINSILWKIEDDIRVKEKKGLFDEEFIELARSVYKNNDRRASIKREINYKYNSEVIEEKSYESY